jgi:hypothetical protein
LLLRFRTNENVSLSPSYLDSLARLPKTRPLKEFRPGDSGVFLRHDVDHDLDLALEMAFWEREAGHRATYFILPTAEYAKDPRLLLKLRQIEAFGHEIGIHLNFLASWVRGEIASVREATASLLEAWRGAGLRVNGSAAHGDRACYEHSFINYWAFRELKPEDPLKSEDRLSPEGIPDPSPERGVRYPPSHQLTRADGAVLPLWSVSMAELGLDYHATHLRMDRYYSDSGGRWHRTASPLEADLSRGSHQVLMHPEYYRGEPKRVFVVSAARSGSKWLATIAGEATHCRAVHEFSLNHRYDVADRLVAEKRTQTGLTALQRHPGAAAELLLHARKYADDLGRDYLECNVYLTHFLPQLRLLFPEAAIVELHRHPRDVVRSVLNRDWYDTPEDDRHPRVEDPRWDDASQFERACLYAAGCHALIERFAQSRVALEEASANPSAAERFFRSLGIAFYPLLAAESFKTRINANTRSSYPAYDDWSVEQKRRFLEICGPAIQALGYEAQASPASTTHVAMRTPELPRQEARSLFDLKRGGPIRKLAAAGIRIERRNGALEVIASREEHGRLLLGGGKWKKQFPFLNGWRSDPSSYFKVDCRAEVPEGEIIVYALFYDRAGRLLHTRQVARLSPSLPEATGSFRASEPRCRWVNIALYFPRDAAHERRYLIQRLEASRISVSLPQ